MKRLVHSTQKTARARKGTALFISMFFVIAVGALALSPSISRATPRSSARRTRRRTPQVRVRGGSGDRQGGAELQPDGTAEHELRDAHEPRHRRHGRREHVPGLIVNLYAGPTGSTSGQFGRFASVVAEARDRNARVRAAPRAVAGELREVRLLDELRKQASGGTIVFANGDALWGPVWSNDTITIGTGGASFHNDVGTAAPLISKPPRRPSPTATGQPETHQASGADDPGLTERSGYGQRMQFLAPHDRGLDRRVDASRIPRAGPGQQRRLDGRGRRILSSLHGEGGHHRVAARRLAERLAAGRVFDHELRRLAPGRTAGHGAQFFPVLGALSRLGGQHWFDTSPPSGAGWGESSNIAASRAEADSVKDEHRDVHRRAATRQLRCFLGGDPHLVAVARTTPLGYPTHADSEGRRGLDVHADRPVWFMDGLPRRRTRRSPPSARGTRITSFRSIAVSTPVKGRDLRQRHGGYRRRPPRRHDALLAVHIVILDDLRYATIPRRACATTSGRDRRPEHLRRGQ